MPRLSKVLVANRGEIAVRVIRACRDAGLASVAVYADPDRDAPFVRLADEAFALGGVTAGETYLAIDKLLDVARRGRAPTRVHPGYGFLSENADFAQAVIDAGARSGSAPPRRPSATSATRSPPGTSPCARAPRSCPAPATRSPAPTRSSRSPQEHGLPVAIKAAFGGGGRGLKVARERRRSPSCTTSAVREARPAFGRGECFVERYLDKPRHVEAQVLADTHGDVVVVGTRDCSLQRRFQKLVEEAPGAVPVRRAARDDPRGRQGDLRRGGLPRGGHGRVPRRARTG